MGRILYLESCYLLIQNFSIMKKALLLLVVVISLYQCTALVEGGIRQSLIGTWEVSEVLDVESGDISYVADGDLVFIMFENRFCNSFTLFDNGDLDTYYADGSFTSNDDDGTWEYEFLDLTLRFNDGDTLVRSVSVSEEILTLPDTIAGSAKSFTFLKVE